MNYIHKHNIMAAINNSKQNTELCEKISIIKSIAGESKNQFECRISLPNYMPVCHAYRQLFDFDEAKLTLDFPNGGPGIISEQSRMKSIIYITTLSQLNVPTKIAQYFSGLLKQWRIITYAQELYSEIAKCPYYMYIQYNKLGIVYKFIIDLYYLNYELVLNVLNKLIVITINNIIYHFKFEEIDDAIAFLTFNTWNSNFIKYLQQTMKKNNYSLRINKQIENIELTRELIYNKLEEKYVVKNNNNNNNNRPELE